MRKSFAVLTLLFLLCTTKVYATGISVDPFISPDDVTIPHLEQFRTRVVDAINSFPGGNIQAGTITSDKMDANANIVTRWDEAFNNFVYTGLLPTTATGLTTTTTAGTAYINGYRVVKDATSHLYTATKWTYIDLSQNGTYTYAETAIGAAEPSVTANSIRLCRVTTDATDVTAVRDDRVLGITLGVNEDFYIKDFAMNWQSTTVISIDPGLLHNGTTTISKSGYTGLDITDIADYTTGASQRGTSKWLYVYCDNATNFAFNETAPNRHDTSGNTAGILYYYYDGSKYWRCVGAIRLNAVGSGEIDKFYQAGSFYSWDVPVVVSTTVSDGAWASQSCTAAIPAISTRGQFSIGLYVANQSMWEYVRPTGGTGPATGTVIGQGDLSGYTHMAGTLDIMTNSSQSIDHREEKNGGALSDYHLAVKGFYLNIRE